MQSYVYEILNLCNGKFYIGKTLNPKSRKASHFSAARRGISGPLYSAIRKYGECNFEFSIIEVCSCDNQAQEHEMLYINNFEKHQIYNIRNDRIQGPRNNMGKRWEGIKAKDVYPEEVFSMTYKEAKEFGIPRTTWYRNRIK